MFVARGDHFLQQYSSHPTSSTNQSVRGDSQHLTSTSSVSSQIARPPTSQNRDSGQFHSRRVLENFQALFAPYPSRPGPSTSSSVQISQPPKKKGKWSKSSMYYMRETWTHEFFCLADKSQAVAPSKAMKHTLQLPGLGRKKVCFSMISEHLNLWKEYSNTRCFLFCTKITLPKR